MKLINPIKNSTGIGLIEVLITTVVVAVGLLAIASLQGDLMNGSGLNKTRAEAKALCDTKIEELRDRIEKTGASGYDAIASSAANETITGTNETFSRGWVVAGRT
jgi:Tfp pilus assembly protein PilV